MHRSATVFALYLSFAIAVGAACGQPAGPETPDEESFNPSGGTGNTGATGGTGGSVSGGTGGSVTGGTGGSVTGGTGGGAGVGMVVGGAGGVMGGAGRANTGGAGGSVSGSAGTGGAVSAGGAGGAGPSSGGMAGTAAGTGGTGPTVTCDAAFAVGNDGFVRMPGKAGGCYSGYAFAGGDTSSTVVFPGGGMDFTKAMGVLNISGTVGSATEENSYAGNVYFGFNIGQKVGGTNVAVAPTGTGITVTCTGCATPAMRVQLVKGSTQWCAPLTSGTAIPYTTFKTQCWEGGTSVVYAKEPIESIQVSIPGGAADATFDLTVTSVTEN